MNAKELISLLKSLKVDEDGITVLSTSGLVIRGVLPTANDLDIAVTEDVLEQLKTRFNVVDKKDHPNWYVINDKIDCIVDNMEGKKELFDDFYVQDIYDYYKYLRKSKSQKDIDRLPLVEKYIERRILANKYPSLETPNLILRKSQLKDLGDIYTNIWSQKELAENMFWRVSVSLEDAYHRLKRNFFLQRNDLSYFVVLKETNRVIGFAGMTMEDDKTYKEHGLCIAKEYQNKGYGKEIMQAFESLAFDELKAERFIYSCFASNEKSSRLCTSMGFEFLESSPQVRVHDGKEFIVEKYCLEKEKYLELKNNKNK